MHIEIHNPPASQPVALPDSLSSLLTEERSCDHQTVNSRTKCVKAWIFGHRLPSREGKGWVLAILLCYYRWKNIFMALCFPC
ncbi:hypothetical protein MATL_G00116490 [Megalops atlanticus]|uniref:Uncharacterized protein n=1 Tax=Megalops atlanticus TaxID=7932 RepID=A0A9D3Q023_MEGAT|nr:hypothetical protein MATL_G00116490 [Megalops atlanticus]